MIRKTATILLLCATLWAQPKQRHFTFTYKFHLNDVPRGAPVRVWAPLASSDAFQTVRVVNMKGDLLLKQTREAEYGNPMVYAETSKATRNRYDFEITYDVLRRERVVDLVRASTATPNARGNAFAARAASGGGPSKVTLARFLQPDALVPITGQPAEWAAKETAGKSTDLDKARALYEFV